MGMRWRGIMYGKFKKLNGENDINKVMKDRFK